MCQLYFVRSLNVFSVGGQLEILLLPYTEFGSVASLHSIQSQRFPNGLLVSIHKLLWEEK